MLLGYKKAFTVAHFVRQYKKHPRRNINYKIEGAVQADRVARALISDPQHLFGRLLKNSVRVENDTNLYQRATDFIKKYMHVVPNTIVTIKRDEPAWLVIKVGEELTLSSGVRLTPQYLKQRLRNIQSEETGIPRSARRPIAPPTAKNHTTAYPIAAAAAATTTG